MDVKMRNFRVIGRAPLFFLLMFGFFPNSASAQFIPNQSRNRMACSDVRSLEAHVASLASVAAIAAHRTNPVTPNCTWVQGTQYFSELEIGRAIGWLRAGEYLFLLHALTLDGKGYLHPSVIYRRDEWRLNDDCGVSPYKVSLPTGEGYRFFGRGRNGMKPHCAVLVNRRAEADRLNQPPVSYSAHWKSRPVERHLNACRNLEAVANGLDKVVNEQQIRNNSTDVFSRKQGCYQREVDDIMASRFMGLYRSQPVGNGQLFWFEIHQIIYRNDATGALTSAYMPVNPIRGSLFEPSTMCIRSVSSERPVRRGNRTVMLRGATRGTVPPVTIPSDTGNIQLETIYNTSVGLERCHIQRTFR